VLLTIGTRTPENQLPPAPGTLNEPWGLSVDGQGNLYVADTWKLSRRLSCGNGAR